MKIPKLNYVKHRFTEIKIPKLNKNEQEKAVNDILSANTDVLSDFVPESDEILEILFSNKKNGSDDDKSILNIIV